MFFFFPILAEAVTASNVAITTLVSWQQVLLVVVTWTLYHLTLNLQDISLKTQFLTSSVAKQDSSLSATLYIIIVLLTEDLTLALHVHQVSHSGSKVPH